MVDSAWVYYSFVITSKLRVSDTILQNNMSNSIKLDSGLEYCWFIYESMGAKTFTDASWYDSDVL